MIPKLKRISGAPYLVLPPGTHWCTWAEIRNEFARNRQREFVLGGLTSAAKLLMNAGCKTIYVNGSFVTSKPEPDDFDACWDTTSVNQSILDPIFFDIDHPRDAQKRRFWGEFLPVDFRIEGGTSFFDLFQREKFTGKPKGILGIDLRRENDFE